MTDRMTELAPAATTAIAQHATKSAIAASEPASSPGDPGSPRPATTSWTMAQASPTSTSPGRTNAAVTSQEPTQASAPRAAWTAGAGGTVRDRSGPATVEQPSRHDRVDEVGEHEAASERDDLTSARRKSP